MRDPIALTEQLAAFVAGTRPADFPPSVLDAARYYTLDWLGSALAGTATAAGRAFLGHAAAQGAGPATVIGLPDRRGTPTAALANGALSHIVEMDDLHRASVVHPAAVVMPAALAVAEWQRASGLEFLTAVVLGYEVAIRIGEAVGKSHYRTWHNTATCGVFGSAAAAGRLLGLPAEQMMWALGSAGTMAAGLWEFNADGAMSKPLHAGHAASAGLLAADLACRGLTGTRRILEGERGFFAATSQDADPQHVVDGLSRGMAEYKISGVSIKPHASCRHTHPAVDAALRLRDRLGPAVGQIAAVDVATYHAALALTDNPVPLHPHAAKFSLQYCVACALRRGSVGLKDFDDDAIGDTGVRALMERVHLHHDPGLEARYPAAWPVRVSVTLREGQTVTEMVDHPKGDPENPLSWEELKSKLGQMVVGTEWNGQADVLFDRIRNLDQQDRVWIL